jgi:glucan biosynthesis protein C
MSGERRRYDIDWLRIIAMAGIFLLHSLHFFDLGTDWHLRNVDQSETVMLVRNLIDVWAIPLFFVLSGAGAWFALQRASATRFLAERTRRLLVPLYTVGIFAVALPQIYFDAFTNGYRGSFWGIIGKSVGSVRFDPGWPGLSSFFFGHLWFLQFLFLASVLVLPLLIVLRRDSGKRVIGRVAGWCGHRGGVLLLAVPYAVTRIALLSFFRFQHSWADLVCYAVLLVIGYVLMAEERFTTAIKRDGRIALPVGIVALGCLAVFAFALGYDVYDTPFSLKFVGFQLLMAVNTWSWIVVLMSLAAKRLHRPSRILSYANEAVLPFYIFHQTVILGIGWFVIQWDMGILAKAVIITVTSFIAALILYDAFVRHSDVLRFLFGMRPRKRGLEGGS